MVTWYKRAIYANMEDATREAFGIEGKDLRGGRCGVELMALRDCISRSPLPPPQQRALPMPLARSSFSSSSLFDRSDNGFAFCPSPSLAHAKLLRLGT